MAELSPHILVTGSSRGIGAAILAAVRAKGARAIGHAREDSADALGEDLEDPAGADRLWARALERLDGGIDVLINNNAGVFEPVAAEAEDEAWRAAWARTMQINSQAAADLSRRAVLLLADIPLGRVAEPAEIAGICAYLALDAPPSMTGAVLEANGASYVR